MQDKPKTKDSVLTIRIPSDLESYLENLAELLSEKLDDKKTKSWVALQLIKHGTKIFEEKYGIHTKPMPHIPTS